MTRHYIIMTCSNHVVLCSRFNLLYTLIFLFFIHRFYTDVYCDIVWSYAVVILPHYNYYTNMHMHFGAPRSREIYNFVKRFGRIIAQIYNSTCSFYFHMPRLNELMKLFPHLLIFFIFLEFLLFFQFQHKFRL